jgi:hypothetical protein
LIRFLEDYLRVHSDTFDFSTAQLAIKVYQPAQSSYSAVAPPLLQAVLRSVAYSCSCDLAEHNLPGYHLLRESDLAALSSTPPSTEKSSGEICANLHRPSQLMRLLFECSGRCEHPCGPRRRCQH